ncbi:sarcosine oxidase subunit gamma [Pseudooceanicola marinus]|uniref:sarcosine oxidase subunit gamma n=1 Tax=Pseudooceanicola marinus TaxID=396013 RepID=UPI001CD3E7F9|nr:sarcosine oxidase subunit gamma [Pseudooceanicola marinus]MCA1336930.1 sarcosine oxidase subunit gamma [Pseudooceanicola marinus]
MPELTLIAQNALPQGVVTTLAGTRVEVLPMRRLSALMPGPDAGPLAEALMAQHGLGLPAPGSVEHAEQAECLWFGIGQYLLIGPAPAPDLAEAATLTDQSDAWASVLLEGPRARHVLARLCPLDLRARAFAPGATARTELAHMGASVTRTGPDGFRVMVFRSMAETLLHELRAALEAVAARGMV